METTQTIISEEELVQNGSFLLVDFNGQTLEKFLEFSTLTGKKTIYLTSLGGNSSVMVAIADIINQEPNNYVIKLLEMNCSASFLLCLYTQCNIQEIAYQYHLAVSHMWHSCQFNPREWTKQEIKDTALMDSLSFDLIKHVLTKKQIKKRERFVKWAGRFYFLRNFMNDDIYLTNQQMKELLGERYTVV